MRTLFFLSRSELYLLTMKSKALHNAFFFFKKKDVVEWRSPPILLGKLTQNQGMFQQWYSATSCLFAFRALKLVLVSPDSWSLEKFLEVNTYYYTRLITDNVVETGKNYLQTWILLFVYGTAQLPAKCRTTGFPTLGSMTFCCSSTIENRSPKFHSIVYYLLFVLGERNHDE